ncbi:MAG: CYTH domain-containing protein [Anaerolineae bacterium]|nr:CYTH domain-containing protein [Anaerolineae bacterium]
MGQEIERKFLVDEALWREVQPEGTEYRQGYIVNTKAKIVRVRIAGDQGYLTIKGATQGATRPEFEYKIPLDDARRLLTLCEGPLIEKTRYKLEVDGLLWEVDEFSGDNEGLIMAELELDSEDQPYQKPAWAGQEVTDDARYYNANLVSNPFSRW